MSKKVLSLILCVTMLFSVVGCGQKADQSGSADVDETENVVTTSPTKESTTPPTTEVVEETVDIQGVETDEKLLTVDITLPADFFTGEDMSTFDPDAYASEQGFLSAKLNEDGSVVVTMTKAKHTEVLEELATSIETSFADLIEAEDTPYIKEITHNDDFTAVAMKVDRTAYEATFDMTPFMLGLNAMIYQMFLEMESYTEVSIIDASTNEVFDTIIYPEALEG